MRPSELWLLRYLLRHQDQVVSRTMMLDGRQDYHFDPSISIINVHISRLRCELQAGFDAPQLHTIPGAGYQLGLDD